MNKQNCRIVNDHFRDRKTGPDSILVVRCKTHKICFSIYPIGYTPYGRDKIAPVSPDGRITTGEQEEDRFAGTYFDAALDAAKSISWRHDYQVPSPESSFITQSLHLKRSCTLFGINPDSDAAQREAVIQLLDVPGQLLHDYMQRICIHSGYQNRGNAVCHILKSLHCGPTLFERFAVLGANVGFWPPLHLWDAQHSCIRQSRFQTSGTRASPG